MPKNFRTLLFLSLILAACSPIGPTPERVAPTLAHSAPIVDLTTIAMLETPATTVVPVSTTDTAASNATNTESSSYPRNCGYQWAQKALPELSADFQQSVQAMQPEAKAYAFAFGEDCIFDDGSATFIPMETDFNITLQAGEPSDEIVGEWVVKVMQVIDTIPPDQIIGPRPGRVSIILESNGGRNGISFYIDQYNALPSGLSNAEIYRALQAQQ